MMLANGIDKVNGLAILVDKEVRPSRVGVPDGAPLKRGGFLFID